jgi:KaiC/GvpD/RAD55 family RecA-like ATPase
MSDVLVQTGIAPLDVFLKGGLPPGFTVLLEAPAGSGAEIFAKQFAAGERAGRCIFVSTDESSADVQAAMATMGWPVDRLQVMDLQTAFAQAMMDAYDRPSPAEAPTKAPVRSGFDPRDLVEGTSSRDLLQPRGKAPAKAGATPASSVDYLGRLLEPFTRVRRPERMVVHSIDFFLNLHPADQVVAVLTALKAANASSGGLLLLVVAKGAHGASVERRLELLADCLLELEVTRKGTTFERFFMVRKVRNRSTGMGVSTYEVTPTGFVLETLERIV